jgi:hypothetical protein
MDYYELHTSHLQPLKTVRKHAKDKQDAIDKLDEIIQRALKKIAIKLHNKGEDVRPSIIDKKRKELYSAANRVFEGDSYESGWAKCLKEAGINIGRGNYQKLTLQLMLTQLDDYSDNPNDYWPRKIKDDDPRFFQTFFNHPQYFGKEGCMGKALILIGIDYANRKGVHKKKLHFSLDELANITNDISTNNGRKARCIFNALALQYYDWPDFEHEPTRVYDQPTPGVNIFSIDYYIGDLKFDIHRNRNTYYFTLTLSERIKNPYHSVTFRFTGMNRRKQTRDFTVTTQRILNNIIE